MIVITPVDILNHLYLAYVFIEVSLFVLCVVFAIVSIWGDVASADKAVDPTEGDE